MACMKGQLKLSFTPAKKGNSTQDLGTISDAMNTSTIYKSMLSEVDKLLKLYYTFPVTTASSERSFSSLRRIKTFLRTTMTECRLNNVFFIICA